MLAELAAANAAFQVIKQAVSNGKDIAAAGSAIAKFVGAKQDLERKSLKKGGGSDLEEFMALEQIREKEEELRQMMQLYGRGGLYNDYVKFCAEARKNREYRKKEHEKMVEKIKEGILAGLIILVTLGGFVGIVYLLYLKHNGKLEW